METLCFYIDIANWAARTRRNRKSMQKLGAPTNQHLLFVWLLSCFGTLERQQIFEGMNAEHAAGVTFDLARPIVE